MDSTHLAAVVFALSSLPAFAIARMLRRDPARRQAAPVAVAPGKAALDRRLAGWMDAVGVLGLAAAGGLWWAGGDRGRATLVVVAMVVLVNAMIVAVLLSIFAARRKRRGRP